MFARLFDWAAATLCDLVARRVARELSEASGETVEPPASLLLSVEPEAKATGKRRKATA